MKLKDQIVRFFAASAVAAACMLQPLAVMAVSGAGDLGNSDIVKGTVNLLNDITSILLWIAPIAGIACIIYFQIRKSAADESEQKRWQDRTITAVVCIIVAVCASALIKLIVNNYMGANISSI